MNIILNDNEVIYISTSDGNKIMIENYNKKITIKKSNKDYPKTLDSWIID